MPDFDFETTRKLAVTLLMTFTPISTALLFVIASRLRSIDKKLSAK